MRLIDETLNTLIKLRRVFFDNFGVAFSAGAQYNKKNKSKRVFIDAVFKR